MAHREEEQLTASRGLILNKKYGRWTIIGPAIQDTVKAKCDCGMERWVSCASIKTGASRSCGCLRDELTRVRNRKHGYTIRSNLAKAREYGNYYTMLNRCYSPSHARWKYYGKRGIKVCARWRGPNGFLQFIADMGPRPEGYTLERLNNDRNYSPKNCIWASPITQANNKQNTPKYTRKGKTQSLTLWARELGIPQPCLWRRLQSGYSVKRSFTTPPGQLRAHKNRTRR